MGPMAVNTTMNAQTADIRKRLRQQLETDQLLGVADVPIAKRAAS